MIVIVTAAVAAAAAATAATAVVTTTHPDKNNMPASILKQADQYLGGIEMDSQPLVTDRDIFQSPFKSIFGRLRDSFTMGVDDTNQVHLRSMMAITR